MLKYFRNNKEELPKVTYKDIGISPAVLLNNNVPGRIIIGNKYYEGLTTDSIIDDKLFVITMNERINSFNDSTGKYRELINDSTVDEKIKNNFRHFIDNEINRIKNYKKLLNKYFSLTNQLDKINYDDV